MEKNLTELTLDVVIKNGEVDRHTRYATVYLNGRGDPDKEKIIFQIEQLGKTDFQILEEAFIIYMDH